MSDIFWAHVAANPDRRHLRYFVTVQGIPYAFMASADYVPVATCIGSGFAELYCVSELEQGESSLDLVNRRQIGGSLRVVLQETRDGDLLSLFSPRSGRSTWVNSTAAPGDTTISVDDSSTLVSPVYIGSEAITFSGSTGTSITGCTRGAYSTEGQRHVGDATQGASVYNGPPSWVGRRVYLHAYAFPGTNLAEPDYHERLGTFRLEEAPAYLGRGNWELRCSELSDEVAQRSVGVGVEEVDIVGDPGTLTASGNAAYTIPDEHAHLFAEGTSSHVAVRYVRNSTGDTKGYIVAPIVSVTGGVVTYGPVPTDAAFWMTHTPESIRPVSVVSSGLPGSRLAEICTSRLGTAANGSSDVLAGTESDGFGRPSMRMGAGILAAEIDSASFASAASFGVPWSYVIDGEQSLGDVLADFTLHTRSCWFVDRDGKLVTKSLGEQEESSVTTIDDGVMLNGEDPQVSYDEENIFPRVQIQCDYSIWDRKFKTTINVSDGEIDARYPYRGDILTVSSRSAVTTLSRREETLAFGRQVVGTGEVADAVRSLQVQTSRGNVIVKVKCTLAAAKVWLGDRVALDMPDTPNFSGGFISTGSLGRVIGYRPDWNGGTVSLTIQLLEALAYIAPACTITSAAAAGTNIVLSTTGYENSSGATPTDMFGVGWQVYLLDVSTGALESILIANIVRGTDTIVSTNPIAGTYVAGDYLIMGDAASNVSSVVDSYNGKMPSEFAYQVPDDENDADILSRWR